MPMSSVITLPKHFQKQLGWSTIISKYPCEMQYKFRFFQPSYAVSRIIILII